MYTQNKSNMKNVYFIETIQSYRTAVGKDVYTILFEHVDAQSELVTFSPREYEKLPTLEGTNRELHEGQYVYYDTEARQFTPAYNDPLARRALTINQLAIRKKAQSSFLDKKSKLFSEYWDYFLCISKLFCNFVQD